MGERTCENIGGERCNCGRWKIVAKMDFKEVELPARGILLAGWCSSDEQDICSSNSIKFFYHAKSTTF